MAEASYGVLVVDDNPDVLDIYVTYFREAEIPVHSARSVSEGLEVLRREKIGFLVLDLHMPGTTGDVALLSLRQTHPDIRVAVVSGFLDEGTEKQLRSLGASAIYHKPVRLEQLITEARVSIEYLEARDARRRRL